ncbi:uncharacterized protein DS421_10g295380 [Arachis hypogaea]|nr:uncharacterized protein DS421_10g295380 [Arachis hypogaea]
MAFVDWVDVTVLGEEPLVDVEFITHLRTHHRLCTSDEDESKLNCLSQVQRTEFAMGGPTERPIISSLLQAVEGHHPFFLDDNSSPRFPLYWLEASPCEKYGLDDLDEVEAAIVGFLREVWGRAPYLDTKKFLQGSSTFIQAQLEMAKTNAQESYQRVQEAKAKSRARTGGTRVISPPPPRNVGTLSKPIVISSSAFSQPPPVVRPSPEPEKKKRKTLESGSSSEVKADALAFVRKNIYPHARISMDDVSVRSHLTTMVEESLKAAGVCSKLLDIFEKAPLSSLGMTSRVEELEGRLRSYQEHERELKEEVAKLKEERDALREKGKNDLLNSRKAYDELEDSIADGAEETWRIFLEQVRVIAPDLDLSPLHPDKVVIDGAIVDPPVPVIISESELKTRGQRIIESPPRGKDVSSSSAVPPISSSSPMDASLRGPGGAPPDSGGGDLSTPLPKK